MKNLLFIFALVFMFGGSASANFVDYGVNANGNQCFDKKDADGKCDIIYSNDFTLIGQAGSLNVTSSSKVAQPNAPTMKELTERQKEVRRQICMILDCGK